MLPRRIPKASKRASRWRSQAHCNFVRGFACAMCGSTANIEVAHVRIGSGAGMGQKPDDWNTVPLCGGPEGCHARQHRIGEPTFWSLYKEATGNVVETLLDMIRRASPKRREIEQVQRERESSSREPGLANNRPGSLA